jgi:type IV fimbrial biogenesis protein FimT
MPPSSPPAPGFTLWQLLAAMCIAAVLAASALPSFSLTFANARATASVNLLLGSLHLARTVAVMQAEPTAVCLSADGRRCIEQPRVAARGWLVFSDLARGGPVQLDPEDTLLRTVELPERVSVRGSRSAVTYWPVARAGTNATFLVCHPEHPQHGRAVVVSQTGRARTAPPGQGADALRCP